MTVAKAWHKQNGEQRHELNIGAGTLDRPIESVVSTLLHEMVHLYNLQNGIQDCSRGGTYHNKKFRDAAVARDLDISYDSRIGWSITHPTEALIDFTSPRMERYRMGRDEGFSSRGHWRQGRRPDREARYSEAQQHKEIYLPLLR